MLLYENIFNVGSTFYERMFDTETKKSIFEKIDMTAKIYEPDPYGKFSYFLDKSIKLKEVEYTDLKEFVAVCKSKKEARIPYYGKTTPKYQYIRDNYYFDKDNKYFNNDHDMRIFYLDIEVSQEFGFPFPYEAKAPITLIQIYDNFDDRYYVVGYDNIIGHEDPKNIDRVKEYNKINDFPINTTYIKVQNEREMIDMFCKLIKTKNPSIMTAWNGDLFDFPYLIHRMQVLKMNPGNLSPVNGFKYEYKKFGNSDEYKIDIAGIYLLDLMVLYKKFIYTPQSSYSLNNIATVELGAEKVAYGEYDNLDELMKNDYIKFVKYGIVDIELILGIDKKLNLINLVKAISFKMGICLDDSLGTVKPWGTYINNIAYSEGFILPNDGSSGGMDYDGIKGAWVADPIVGKHNWVVSFDWASLYPSIIRWCNFSPETWIPTNKLPRELVDVKQKYFIDDEDHIIGKEEELLREVTPLLEKYNLSAGINGSFYTKEYDGLIPRLIKQLYGERKSDKKEMFKYTQLKEKIKGIIQDKSLV